MPEDVLVRHAVRALLVAADEPRVLLSQLLVPDSGRQIWLAPGGGIEPGEDHAAALKREVFEETGWHLDEAQGPVWCRQHEFVFRGRRINQHETYYVAVVPHFTPTLENNVDASEAELMGAFKWWPLDEIQASDDIFVPVTFGQHFEVLLEGLARGELAALIDVGV